MSNPNKQSEAILSDKPEILPQVAHIVAAYLSRNAVALDEVPALIRTIGASLSSLDAPVEPPAPFQAPAVPIRKSVTPDYLVCLEDGKRLKMLKRHLRTSYNLTPDQYRAKWNLPADYPMVAPSYAAARSQVAKNFGLGRKPGDRPKGRTGAK